MKNIYIILLLIIWSSNISAQEDLPYKPISEFGTDTSAFLRYNFVDREKQYIGKSMDDVINDIQLPITDVMFSFAGRQHLSIGVYVYIYGEEKSRNIRKTKDNISHILIKWDEPIEFNKRLDTLELKRPIVVDEVLDYFRSENRKVSSVTAFYIPDEGYYTRLRKETDPPAITHKGDTIIIHHNRNM